jgi:hypothetical protein
MGGARALVDVSVFLPGRVREVGHRQRVQRIVGVKRQIARDVIVVYDGMLPM